jgi:predicted enzyme related to lactoylglutathione lyase
VPTILQNHYVLAVHDLERCASFFVEQLGFAIVDEPPGWTFVAKDGCMVMLGACPDDLHPSALGCHSYFGYLRVDDATAYHADVLARSGEILSPLSDKPWGMREFSVRTPEGHRITIGQAIGRRASIGPV